jgi:hypothetical protein
MPATELGRKKVEFKERLLIGRILGELTAQHAKNAEGMGKAPALRGITNAGERRKSVTLAFALTPAEAERGPESERAAGSDSPFCAGGCGQFSRGVCLCP